MVQRIDRRGRGLMLAAIACAALSVVTEFHDRPGVLHVLIVELLEAVLLAGLAVTCALQLVRVRVREVAAAAAMLSLLLAGEAITSAEPIGTRALLTERKRLLSTAGSG